MSFSEPSSIVDLTMSVKSTTENACHRRGVIAVCVRGGELLVIQRSEHVEAPGAFCFPGGAIEADESEDQALIREMREELNVSIEPLRRLWRSQTGWGVDLCWWLSHIPSGQELRANPQEVAGFQWLSPVGIRGLTGVLSSNVAFLDALSAGEFNLDGSCGSTEDSSGGGSNG